MATVPYPSAATYPPQIHHHHAFPFRFSPAYAPTPVPAYSPASVPVAATHSSSPYFSAPPRFPSTYPALASGSCPAPSYDPSTFALQHHPIHYPTALDPAPPTGAPSVSTTPETTRLRHPEQVLSSPFPSGRSNTTPWLLDAVPTAPNRERRPPQSHAVPTSPGKRGSGLHPATSASICKGCDLTKGPSPAISPPQCTAPHLPPPTPPYQECRPPRCHDSVSPATSIAFPSPRMCASSLLERPDMAPLLALPKAKSTSLTEMEPVFNAPTIQSAEAQVQAEATISKDVSRAVLDLKCRLDAQLARDRTSFDKLKGELEKLTSMAAQLATFTGKHTTAAIPGSSPLEVTCTAPVASKVFDTMPTSSSGCSKAFGKQSSAAASSPTTSGSSRFGASGSTFAAPQVFGETPTSSLWQGTHGSVLDCCSGRHNPSLSACVSNFSEQNFDETSQQYDFTNLSLKTVSRADGTKQSYYALPENYPLARSTSKQMSAVFDDKTKGDSNVSIDVCATIPEQQPFEDTQQGSGQSARSIKLKHGHCIPQVLEYAYTPGCAIGDALLTDYKWNMLLSGEGIQVWDPGDYTSLSSRLNRDILEVLSFLSQQIYCKVPPRQDNRVLQFEWDLGILSLLNMLLGKTASLNQVHSGHSCPVNKEVEVKVDSGKPIISPERPTDGIFSFTVEKKSENELLAVCFNNTSDNAFVDTDFPIPHGPVTHASRSIDLTKENSTQVASVLFIQGATVHFTDETSTGHILTWNPWPVTFYLCQSLWKFSKEQATQMPWDPGEDTIAMACEQSTTCHRIVCMEMQYCSTTGQVTQQKWEFSFMIAKASQQVQYCCLPFVLDCSYSEPIPQLVCYTRMFSSTKAILSALCMSTASTLFMILVLSFEEIAEQGKDGTAVYQVSKIQLPMRQISHAWDPGIKSILVFYKGLHTQMIHLVHCSIIHACDLAPAHLPPKQISAYCPSNIGFVHEQGVQKNYNANNLLSSQKYLQIVELDIIFITFLPP